MPKSIREPTVHDHFEKRPPEVRAIYDRVLAVTRKFGKVKEDPNQSSIHLVRQTAFAGVATRNDGILLSFKATADIRSARIVKHERPSTNRWYLYVRLESPKQIDPELTGWLEDAYEMSG